MTRIFKILTILFPSFILLGCNPERSQGLLLISNDSGETVFIETNLKSADGISQTSFHLEDDVFIDLCNSKVIDGSVRNIGIGEICPNFTEGFVTLYKLDSSGNKIKCREWNYAGRNNSGRQFFNSEYLEFNICNTPDAFTSNDYVFTILPEDLE